MKTKDNVITSLKDQYKNLLEQFRLSQQKQFGKSSETSDAQLGLFNEAENIAEEEQKEKADAEKENISGTRNQPKRRPLPKDLPRETVIHDISDADKICIDCGHALHKMGEEKSEQLEFVPAHVKVIENIRLKYSCRSCELQGIKTHIKIAPAPNSPIPKSMATPSLLSHVITNKYQYALPLYRQESLFKQYGIDLNRKTLSSWMLKIIPLLNPVYKLLHQIQLKQTAIHADETPLTVIHADKNKCYMWVYCTGTDSPKNKAQSKKHDSPNIVLYDYQNSRSAQCVNDYLQTYNGYLQVDGYAGYESTKTTLVGCWAHARRKFMDVKKTQVKGKIGKADWAINHIQKLYRIEKEIKDKSAEEKYKIRQKQSKALLEEFKKWLDKSVQHVPPTSSIGKAIAYCIRQWPKLKTYIESGELNIDNNRAERALKPFVIGRKNWMFANTENGATASAVLYSLIETAKANGLIPFDYLKLLFEKLPGYSEEIIDLMPWNVALTEKSPKG
ncbi:MAG: IS66 family transposase [Thiohalomonadales bacterium]